ncbi:MAG TPA: hypothetical protein EYG94_05110 [Campylobacterales bacterium]|nr:hypothetical protein [Campylobacterales bacterium]
MKILMYIVVGFLVLFLVPKGLKEFKNLTRKPSMPQTISMILEEKSTELDKRVANLISERHSTGMMFEKIHLHGHDTIRLQLSDSYMDFKNPMLIDIAHMTPFIEDFSMYLGISPRNIDTHAYAKYYMYAMVKELRAKGWTRYISSGAPRIIANEIVPYNADPGFRDVSLSDTYEMSMEEWVSIAVFHWSFYYKNEALIHMHLRREGGANTKTTSDGYFLHVDVMSPAYNIKRNVGNKNWKKWRELWKPMALRFLSARPKYEKRVIAEGYHIDESYLDAPYNRGVLPGEDYENEELGSEKVTVTKTGYWQSYIASSKPLKGLSKREGGILFYKGGMVFIEKDEELAKYHDLLRWRFLGTKDEYDLVGGKLIKKEPKQKEKVISFSEGDVCPKNGYWEAFLYKEEGSKGIAYFKKGEALSTNSKDPIAMLFKWKYLGDENDFKVMAGKLVRRT